ncbi:Solute carrier family 35 member F6 [Chlorella sorokiniana]|uniref:Solute carrier family 35 member F6 n=1 Tax=Chlorella sorokiniana TaxID=3076 RepID=A0A2P6TG57_CHLSO|nr:Solute carrier family 35 member F6 [Chlorella sorokiniana]|eukprot:PRW33096.1 Solute carrier family 35 member F6 [Chlorella sorokiniana]
MEAAGLPQPVWDVSAVSSLDDLPDQLLGHIFALAGLKGLLPSALLVCKRWQAVLYATPALWRRLELEAPNIPAEAAARWAAWEAALDRLLRRVSGVVAAARLASRSRRDAHWVSNTLHQLQPATVTDVSILAYQLPPSVAALEPLRRLTQLSSLQLNCEGVRPAESDPLAGLARLLPALPLRRLQLDARGLPPGIVSALVQLSSLSELHLVSRAGRLPDLHHLTALAQLRQLHVEDRGGHHSIQPPQLPAPANFEQLEQYSFHSLLGKCLLLGGLMLEGIRFSCTSNGMGAGLPGAAQGTLNLTGARVLPPREQSGWQPWLPSAVPRSKQLHSFGLLACGFGLPGAASSLLGPQQWAQLRELCLQDCCGPTDMDGVVAELLAAAPQLTQLKLVLSGAGDPAHAIRLHTFPAAIFSHPSLTKAEVLSVFEEDWDSLHLPPLPDPRLEVLHVVGFRRLPPTLAAVTSLTELRLGSTRPFRLGKSGLAALQQLPRLAMLALPPLSGLHRLSAAAKAHWLCASGPEMSSQGNGKLSARLGGAALVVTGSGSTLLSKSLYGVRAPRMADGRPKLFRKPLANTTLMFFGMALLLPLMLRGSEIVFTALLAVVFLRRRLTRRHAGGPALVVMGIAVVGAAGLLAHPQVAPSDVSRRHAFAGMVITVLSEALHAAQIVVEDHYLSNLHLEPLTVVGVEGVLGVATMLGLVLPLAQHLPGADGKGLHEDTWDSLYMLRHSGQLRAVALSYVAVAGAFNLSGMMMTDSVGAVYRTMLESLRMLSVWVLDLVIWYTLDGEDHRFGEPWTVASWLQAAGFALLVAGTALYANAGLPHSSNSSADPVAAQAAAGSGSAA